MLELTGLVGFLILVVDIYAIYRTWGSGASELGKAIWTALIFFLPILGFVLWLLLGPKGRAPSHRYS